MRLQLFEIEDFSWYPSFLRELQTDFLRKLMDVFKVYKAVIPAFVSFLEKSESTTIIDLCSGGGGAWNQVLPKLKNSSIHNLVLTDLYPNIKAFQKIKNEFPFIVSYLGEPMNAITSSGQIQGTKTFFNSFHHFQPKDASSILKTIVSSNEPVAIFEPMDKSILQFFLNTISTFLLCFLFTPFIRPFRWDRIIFTYFIPLVPLITLWDGWVSLLRLYSYKKLLKMAETAGPNYEWEAGRATHFFGKVTYLMGRPKK